MPVALYLTERDVEDLLTMDMCLLAVEEAFRSLARGDGSDAPRRRLRGAHAVLADMAAAVQLPSGSFLGAKVYGASRQGARFVVLLFDGQTGALLAVIEADRLGQMRTGAASGLATRSLARPDARRLVVFGAGWQAEAQVKAVARVRHLVEVQVVGRRPERVHAFCRRLSAVLDLPVVPATSPEAAVRQADILVTATTSAEPLFPGEWVPAGCHVNAVGSNRPDHREVDGQLVGRSTVVVDSLATARAEAGDLLLAEQEGAFSWERARELGHVLSGMAPGRTSPAEITLFCSQGIAAEDVAVAAHLVAAAQERGRGRRLEEA